MSLHSYYILGLIGPLLNVYPLDIGATEAQYTTIASLRSLPAAFKLPFGFLSDNLPILGYRRKSYMMGGWLLVSLSMGIFFQTSDLTLGEERFKNEQGQMENRVVVPKNAPSIPALGLVTLLFGTGFWYVSLGLYCCWKMAFLS